MRRSGDSDQVEWVKPGSSEYAFKAKTELGSIGDPLTTLVVFVLLLAAVE